MLDSLRRAMHRLLALWIAGWAFLLVAKVPTIVGVTGGPWPVLAPWCFGAGLVFLGLAAGDIAMRMLQPRIDSQDMAMHARRNGCTASGLVFLGHCVLRAAILLLMVTAARAAEPPPNAVPLLPVLKAQQQQYWAEMPLPSALGAQVEQETCITLKHRSCWSTSAQLRTSREQGISLGQLTRAWRADGSLRFDAIAELRAAHPAELAELKWDGSRDAAVDLRALVLKDRDNFRRVHEAATAQDQLAFAVAGYNGGEGGVRQDRVACDATANCDSGRWFGFGWFKGSEHWHGVLIEQRAAALKEGVRIAKARDVVTVKSKPSTCRRSPAAGRSPKPSSTRCPSMYRPMILICLLASASCTTLPPQAAFPTPPASAMVPPSPLKLLPASSPKTTASAARTS
jgi:hypothetical protein